MAGWGWVAIAYATYVVLVALGGRTGHPIRAIVGGILFAVGAAAGATRHDIASQVIAPGAIALAGYWLSGLFVGTPQPWLEERLLSSDRKLFERWSIDR